MTRQIEIRADEAVVYVHDISSADPLPDLVGLELSLRRKEIRSIKLAFHSGVAAPVDRLERLDYRCISPHEYVKSIPARRSARFSITEKCNYRCFFCHEEGLQMDLVRTDADDVQLFRLLDQLKALNYNDLTFTGGEPLLKIRRIIRCLDYMQRIDYLPDVKIVTNGRILNRELILQLKRYCGNVRFNISMHSVDSLRHYDIVLRFSDSSRQPRDELSRIKGNLSLLRDAEVPFKLNFVLLRGINTDPSDIEKILTYALDSGASRVKFLELLITKKLKHLYPYYYRLDALKDQLGDRIALLDKGIRRTVYRYRDTPLQIELQSCTCSKGCNVCALNRDVNFTAELRYFPCFLHPEEGADLNTAVLADAVEAGSAYIADMASRFGDHSPIIVRGHYLTSRETFYYYEIAADAVATFIEHYLLTKTLDLERHRCLTEYYFSDGADAFSEFEYVHKLAINSYDHHATEIIQQHKVDKGGSGRIETSFERESRSAPSIDTYIREMRNNGSSVVMQADWSIDYYAVFGQAKSDFSVSIGIASGRDAALVRCNRPIIDSPCQLRPLTQTVPAWLAAS